MLRHVRSVPVRAPHVRLHQLVVPTVPYCKQVLREGTQRQRAVAALLRCLLQPGTLLFPTAAPAWRQQRLLAAAHAA